METAVALDPNFKFPLMSRILVAVEKMVASCYNRDQTWLCVYCWCQTPSGVVSPRGETTPLGVWHQQYTHNHVWSLKYLISVHNWQKWFLSGTDLLYPTIWHWRSQRNNWLCIYLVNIYCNTILTATMSPCIYWFLLNATYNTFIHQWHPDLWIPYWIKLNIINYEKPTWVFTSNLDLVYCSI